MQVVFPALEILDLSGLHKMEKIWHQQLLTASKLLIQLRWLKLKYCGMMKEIIPTEREGDAVVVDTIVFPELFGLRLSQLPELTSFYQGNCILEFHSLENLKIEKCPKMQTFVGSSTKRPKEASEEGLEGQTDQESKSSVTIQPFFNEKVQALSLSLSKLLMYSKGNMYVTMKCVTKKRFCIIEVNNTFLHFSQLMRKFFY